MAGDALLITTVDMFFAFVDIFAVHSLSFSFSLSVFVHAKTCKYKATIIRKK
jgi:hypothetical protein